MEVLTIFLDFQRTCFRYYAADRTIPYWPLAQDSAASTGIQPTEENSIPHIKTLASIVLLYFRSLSLYHILSLLKRELMFLVDLC